MERYPAQPSYELVLDARRLIIACTLVIFVCGIFFVLGFVEGKRQVIQASITEKGVSPANVVAVAGAPKSEPAATKLATTAPETPVRQVVDQQSRYDKPGTQAEQARPQPRPDTTPKSSAVAASAKPGAAQTVSPAKPAGGTFYSCQVGAFRQQKEAQVKADELKKRGYDSVIEPPASAGGLFLLKVGRFPTRADAVAMQGRLKKAGYNSFIKTSR